MPAPTFRGDPYRVLDVPSDASEATIKRRWRQLAREQHPDRAETAAEAADRTRRMARINAAYDLLRHVERRAAYDRSSGEGRFRAGGSRAEGPSTGGPGFADRNGASRTDGPPPPPRSRPVTGRFDTSAVYHRRNTVTSEGRPRHQGQAPISNRERTAGDEPLRASTPTGPVQRRRSSGRAGRPSLEEAWETLLLFGKFRGHTLGQVADFEPSYIDWIATTITRDRDLVVKARVIQSELDERGVVRRNRPATPGFGAPKSLV